MLPAIRAKQRKFTPENIARIKDWLAQGVRREEIANRLEVSVGSLQVTCSRLGISLRKRPPVKGGGPVQPLGVVQCENIHYGGSRARPKFTLLMQKRGRQAAFDLPLSHDVIKQLSLEGWFRGDAILDLIGNILDQLIEKGLVGEMRPPPAPEAAMAAFAKSWRRQ